MEQYFQIKDNYQDCILFYRVGDFYEMFYDDALEASRVLEIALTGKNCGQEERAPMCGVPFHSAETYIHKLVDKGYKVGILDADITGPSIPKMFGIKEKAYADEIGMYPVKSKGGIDVMSVNLLLENDTDPVLWRGPILGNVVKQFYTDVIWKDIDYLFVDMPPGTGDVAITVYQSLKLDGIIIVTSPQDLVSMIVEKAVKMADLMQVPIIGVVENYSYFHCPDNGKDYQIFGESHIEEILQKYGLLLLNRLPIDPTIANLCDQGDIESIEKTNLENVSLPE